MKLGYAVLLPTVLGSTVVLAQPTIDAGNNVPMAGTEYLLSASAAWIWEGPAGPDALYGHWMYPPTGNRNVFYVDPSASNTSAQVPGTVLLSTDGGTDTLFWGLTANGLEILAERVDGLGLVVYTDPLLELKYPCTFNTSWTDAINATYTVSGFSVQRTGTITGLGDGYGTLELPELVVPNVLRVKVRREITDVSPLLTVQRTSETHYFFSTLERHPVLRLQLDSTTFGNGAPAVTREAQWLYGNGDVSVGELDANAIRFTAYPNPANGPVHLSFGSSEHPARHLQLVDATGRLVLERGLPPTATGDLNAAFDATGLAPGVYHIRLLAQERLLGTQKLVVQ